MTSDGHFDGHITTGNGHTFYIEPASRYFSRQGEPPAFHSVIYSSDDVIHPGAANADDSSGNPDSCKSHELHLKVKEARLPGRSLVTLDNNYNVSSSFMPSVITKQNYRSKRSTSKSSNIFQQKQQPSSPEAGQLFEALPESKHMHGGSPVVHGAQRQVTVTSALPKTGAQPNILWPVALHD